MIIAITILSTLFVLLVIYSIAITIHIYKIQKELTSIDDALSKHFTIIKAHQADIVTLIKQNQGIIVAVNEISDVIEGVDSKASKSVVPYFGPVGEA